MNQRIWTISNVLSVLRVALVLPVALLAIEHNPSHRLYAAGLIFLAAMTDLIDGALARRLGQVTDLGKIIDPLADKLAIGIIVILLAKAGMVPMWFVILALGRDILIFCGGIYIKRKKQILLQSNTLGKWAATSLATYLLVTFLGDMIPDALEQAFLILSVVLLLMSFASYSRRFATVASASGKPELAS